MDCISIATIVITIATVILAGLACLGTWIQYQHYRKTMRPFICVTNCKKIKSNPIHSQIEYYFNNVGSLPAKDVQNKSEFIKEPIVGSKLQYDSNNPSASIFPDTGPRSATSSIVENIELENEIYFKICIVYSDTRGKTYHTTDIFLIQNEIYHHKSDFD